MILHAFLKQCGEDESFEKFLWHWLLSPLQLLLKKYTLLIQESLLIRL